MQIDSYFDRIFVINLDNRTDRWQSTLKELEKVGITNYERFSAVQISNYEDIDPILYSNLDFKKHKDNKKYHIGIVGCKLSHLSVIKIAKERGYKRILILEDDNILNSKESFQDIFRKSIAELEGENWDMLYLGGTIMFHDSLVPSSDKKYISSAKRVYATSAYALNNTNNIFDFIIDNLETYGSEIDIFYVMNIQNIPSKLFPKQKPFSIGLNHNYKSYAFSSFIFRQGNSKSDILPPEKPSFKFYGQFGQDKYCFEHFLKNKKGGTFLDIGASDGITFSNTHFFEKERGYNGLCIEPREEAFRKLTSLRSCFCENVAIDVTEEEEVPFYELYGYGSGLSGIMRNYDTRHIKRIEQEKKNPNHKRSEMKLVKTRKIRDLLEKYNLFHIDFLSLDTEGGELDILKSFDWEKTTINVITVENNYKDPEFKRYLESIGFVLKTKIACDEIYVHNSFLKS